MGRELIHGKKSVWIVETFTGDWHRVSPLFDHEDDLICWLVGRGYSRKAAETFVEKGMACSMVFYPTGVVMDINQFDPENSRGSTWDYAVTGGKTNSFLEKLHLEHEEKQNATP
jgi:hypothetical protein